MTMKIEPVPATLPVSAEMDARADIEHQAGQATDKGKSTTAKTNAAQGTEQAAFASLLAGLAAPLQNKVKSSLPLPDAPVLNLGAGEPATPKNALANDKGDRKKGAPKASPALGKKSASPSPEASIPIAVQVQPSRLGAIPLALPSFEAGAPLTSEAASPGPRASGATTPVTDGISGANVMSAANEVNVASGLDGVNAASAAMVSSATSAASIEVLDHAALGLEASTATDARNGFAANSGVHRTAKAIADDQARAASAPSESAKTYAAVAKATSAALTQMIHAAAAPSEGPRARRSAGAGDAAPEAKESAVGDAGGKHANAVAQGEEPRGTGGSPQGDARDKGADDRAEKLFAKDETKTAQEAAAVTGGAHTTISLPLPQHPGLTIATAGKPDTELRARFAEDTLAGVERAAVSGQERTDFEVRAFDGTRVAVRVQMKNDQVHVGFAFDAKHSAAEATVRATVGSLETRLGERGLSTVVSFGGLQRAPHEVGIVSAGNAGGSGNATANGNGGNKGDDPRDRGQVGEVTELTARGPKETRAPKAPVPNSNGRGGWVA